MEEPCGTEFMFVNERIIIMNKIRRKDIRVSQSINHPT